MSSKLFIGVLCASLLAGCLEDPNEDASNEDVENKTTLLDNQRLIDGNLTWEYLDQFVIENPTDDLSGTWVALNSGLNSFTVWHMTGEYDADERYHYFNGPQSSGSPRIKTDDEFNILAVSASAAGSTVIHSNGHFEFRSIGYSSVPYKLKKISNNHIDIGNLDLTTYLYGPDESHVNSEAIAYYEERWDKPYSKEIASFSWAKVETTSGTKMYFSGLKYCSLESELISTKSYSDCSTPTVGIAGVELEFSFMDTDGNTATGSYQLSYADN